METLILILALLLLAAVLCVVARARAGEQQLAPSPTLRASGCDRIRSAYERVAADLHRLPWGWPS